jgi:hypothetical protein
VVIASRALRFSENRQGLVLGDVYNPAISLLRGGALLIDRCVHSGVQAVCTGPLDAPAALQPIWHHLSTLAHAATVLRTSDIKAHGRYHKYRTGHGILIESRRAHLLLWVKVVWPSFSRTRPKALPRQRVFIILCGFGLVRFIAFDSFSKIGNVSCLFVAGRHLEWTLVAAMTNCFFKPPCKLAE